MRIHVEKWSLLAGLRFVLASFVLLAHIGFYTGAGWATALGAAFEAVAGFFLISGYSIGSSYSRSPEGFYLRRVERIYPAYIAALLITIVAYGWPGTGLFLANLTFLNQLATNESFLQPAWSLSLEVWLYALTPVIARLSPRALWIAIGVSFFAYIAYVPMRPLLHLPYFASVGFGANLLLLSFFWLAGFALSRAQDKRRVLLIIGLGLLIHLGEAGALQAAYQFKNDRLGTFLAVDVPSLVWRGIVLATVVAAFYAIIAGRVGAIRSRLLYHAGDVSYPLYLVHVPVIVIALRYGWTDPWLLIVLSLVVAAASTLIFEYPIRHLRKNKPSAITALQA